MQAFPLRIYTAIVVAGCWLGLGDRGWAQSSSTGAVNVVVVDASGAVVPEVTLELQSRDTNDIRTGTTLSNGAFSFPSLQFGFYRLKASKTGFDEAIVESVQVQTSRTTDIRATLAVGRATQTVNVTDASPVIDTSSSSLATTIDTKQVVNLPISGRDVTSLAFLVPGWSSSGTSSTSGTWNNMPGGAVVSADFDGTPGISNRFRSGGFNYGTTAVQPRIENVGEMTIQTGQLDLSGTGTSAMRISIVSRHGTNEFHGRLFEDFRNTSLNANSWINNARSLPRNVIKLNDFGGSIGGPVLKNKLFFFGTWAQSIQPITNTATADVLTPAAQQGVFSYRGTGGALQSVNLLQLGGGAGGRNTLLPNVSDQFQKINGVLGQGTLVPTNDPNLNTFSFLVPARTNIYYPSVRVDYNATSNLRFYATYSQTKTNADNAGTPNFPGGIDPVDQASNRFDNRIGNVGIEWTVSPTLLNNFHVGYLYQFSSFAPENQGIDLTSLYQQNWNYGAGLYSANSDYGTLAYPRLAVSSFYPLLSANDSLSWQKGKHSFVFGGSWYREHDHYWNNPGGYPTYTFGLSDQDPVSAAFTSAFANTSQTNLTNAQNLYAELTGRVSSVDIATGRPLDPSTKQYKPFGAYNLNEAQTSYGFWFQDSWRLRPTLTLNYGLRWDIVGDNHNITGSYSTLRSVGDLWGPTPVGASFSPGTLGGVNDPQFQAQVHAYNTSYVNPSPAIGIAWNPQGSDSFWGRLLGKNTVIRAGYSLRQYLEGAQNFWAYASNSGQFFYQQGSLSSTTAAGVGNFAPGSLTFGDALPDYFLTPSQYTTTTPAANLFPGTLYGLNRDIRQPYVEQWNFGIQRQLGSKSALEVRYVGNLALHQWLGYNINEVNIIENGFLGEFKNAQGNLAANRAAGRGSSFANLGAPGDVALPIFSAAFGSPASSNFSNGTFIQNLNNGAAGTMANTLAGTGSNINFYCNMVGSTAFPACVNRVGNVAGAGYPINFWQVNPYAAGREVNYLDASGSSNYHGLQIEFRQQPTHGAQFNVNYTWSHSLGLSAQNGIQGQNPLVYYTNRNFRLNYGPSLFDIRHVLHLSGTYDLPFGRGKALLNRGGLLDRVVGGWTLGTILVMQSGTPVQLLGGFATLNANAGEDAGIYFNGATVGNVQKSVGVYRTGDPWVNVLGSQFVSDTGAAPGSLQPANTPGVLGYRPYITGPHWFNDDLSINKAIPINERFNLTLQAEFLNLTNHPTFAVRNGGQNAPQSLDVQSLTFAQVTSGPSAARRVEFRANLVF